MRISLITIVITDIIVGIGIDVGIVNNRAKVGIRTGIKGQRINTIDTIDAIVVIVSINTAVTRSIDAPMDAIDVIVVALFMSSTYSRLLCLSHC